jgi:PAS domain S-box-containing protein
MLLPTAKVDQSHGTADGQAFLGSHRRFHFLSDSGADYAFCLLDPGGHVTNWDPDGEGIEGYTAAEIVGQHFSGFFTEADRKAGESGRALDVARETGRYTAGAQRVRKDASPFWANIIIRSAYNEAGQLVGFARVVRDVTEARRIVDALRESEHRFGLFVESVSDHALYMLDPSGKSFTATSCC